MICNESLIDLFNNTAKAYANYVAVIEDNKRTTFAEIKNLSDNVAAGLCSKGIKKGDRVALYCINSANFAIAYMGIVKAGGVVVPINLLQKPREIAYVLNNANVSALIYHEAFQGSVDESISMLDASLLCLCISNIDDKTNDWQKVCDTSAIPPVIDIDVHNDLVAILYTSGTTGKPKGAMLTHKNLVSNTASVFSAMKWCIGKEVVLLVLPMFHAFAATVGMLTPLVNGCAFVAVAKFEPDNLLNIINKTQATVFLGVPSMYSVLLNTDDKKASRFNSVRLCISGGASMPLEVLERFEEKFGVPIYEGDGPTECSPVTCVNPVDGVRKVGTVGLPVPNVEMKIFNEQGSEVPRGVIGEIAVRGPNVMKGYWQLHEATAATFHNDWFLTGDLGTEDKDGYFSILDRKKDMVIVNGMNVYPRIIEEVLYRHDAVLEAAVIGHADKIHGEIPVAYIALKKGAKVDSTVIRTWCRQHLGNYEVPRKVIFMDELPKNAAGKIVKRVLDKQGEVERGIT